MDKWRKAGWPVGRLGDLAEVGAGGPAPQGSEYYDGGIHPFVRMQDVSRCCGIYLDRTTDLINELALQNNKLKLWPENSLLIPKSGASVALNKRALLQQPSYVVSHLAVVSPRDMLDPEFLYFFSTMLDMTRYALDAAYPSLRILDIQGISVPMPPIGEQKQIAAVLKEANAIAALRRDAALATAKLKNSLYMKTFGDPIANQRRWDSPSFGDLLAETPKNGLYKPMSAYGEGTPIVRITDFRGGETLSGSNFRCVSVSPSERKSFALVQGDVLLNRVNSIEHLGKSALVVASDEVVIFESNIMRLRFNEDSAIPEFMINLMQTPSFLASLRSRAKRAVQQASVNQSDVLTLRVGIPPVDLQRRFVRALEEISELQRSDAASRQMLSALGLSLCSRAFTGELTRSWRTRNHSKLTKEAAERDQILGAVVRADNAPPTQYIRAIGETHTQISTNAVLTVRPPRVSDVVPHLNSDQRRVLRALESLSERSGEAAPGAAVHHTAADIARAIRGNLRNDVQAVEGCLRVLDALGLVVSVSRPQREPATNATVFGTCYRLPAQADDSQSDEQETETAAQDVRGEAMAVLTAARDPT